MGFPASDSVALNTSIIFKFSLSFQMLCHALPASPSPASLNYQHASAGNVLFFNMTIAKEKKNETF